MPLPATNDHVNMPPQSIESEESLLGVLMLDRDALVRIADAITPEDFYKDRHRIIFQAMLDLYNAREPIDIVTLSGKLEDRKLLEAVGGRTYLTNLVGRAPSTAHVVSYANIIKQKSTLRKLSRAANDIIALAQKEDRDLSELLDEAEQRLFGVSQHFSKQQFIALKDALHAAMDRMGEDDSKMKGIPTGFADLDRLLAGFHRTDLVILAARPSVGKTSLAMDFIRHAAVNEKKNVGIFSLEMGQEQLTDRMLCAQANIDLHKYNTRTLASDEEFANLNTAAGILSEAPIFIDDSASSNIMEIRTKARRLQAEHGLDFLLIDYLQLMEGRNKESRVAEVSEISRSLKSLARELNIPILALSQLSRAVETRGGLPKLSDLRESGSIEQDADIVMFIHREDRDNPETNRKGIADLVVAKHRNGPVGQIELFFRDYCASFISLDTHHSTGAAPQEQPTA